MKNPNNAIISAIDMINDHVEDACITSIGVITTEGEFYGGSSAKVVRTTEELNRITEALKAAMYRRDTGQDKPNDVARCLRSLRAHLVSIRTISGPNAEEMIDLCLSYVQDLKKALEK
jgi:hypothetical protein